MDDQWNKLGSFFVANDAYNFFDVETAFPKDINGDSYIGLDVTGNGIFEDDDLVAQKVEEDGSTFLQLDINNQCYAGSVG